MYVKCLAEYLVQNKHLYKMLAIVIITTLVTVSYSNACVQNDKN